MIISRQAVQPTLDAEIPCVLVVLAHAPHPNPLVKGVGTGVLTLYGQPGASVPPPVENAERAVQERGAEPPAPPGL